MANYFLSYDLNGNHPTHAEMDEHLRSFNGSVSRVLETVWYVQTSLSSKDVADFVDEILSRNDSLLVIDAQNAIFRNLLVPDQTILNRWSS